MSEITRFLLALADPLRLRSLALIAARGEVCVCQLTHALGVPQPRVSKHLLVLRDAGILVSRRSAQWVLYRLANLPHWAEMSLAGALEGVVADPQYRVDLYRIAAAPGGPPAPVPAANREEEVDA